LYFINAVFGHLVFGGHDSVHEGRIDGGQEIGGERTDAQLQPVIEPKRLRMDDFQDMHEQTMILHPNQQHHDEEDPSGMMMMMQNVDQPYINTDVEQDFDSNQHPTLVDAATGKIDDNMTMNAAKAQYEIKQDTEVIECETFIIPGSKKSDEQKANYKWPFGHADGHMACILGHNTIFKALKQGKDPETGEELKQKWRKFFYYFNKFILLNFMFTNFLISLQA